MWDDSPAEATTATPSAAPAADGATGASTIVVSDAYATREAARVTAGAAIVITTHVSLVRFFSPTDDQPNEPVSAQPGRFTSGRHIPRRAIGAAIADQGTSTEFLGEGPASSPSAVLVGVPRAAVGGGGRRGHEVLVSETG